MTSVLCENLLSSFFIKKVIAIILICIALASCDQVSMDDVSANPKYSKVVGKEFRVKEDLWVLGITTDLNYQDRIDYLILVPGVGFSGPEVVVSERLYSGSTFKITRVLKARSPLFSRMTYVVEEVGSNRFRDHELRVDLVGDMNNQNCGLDEAVYSAELNSEK